jgi:hypothetical protein
MTGKFEAMCFVLRFANLRMILGGQMSWFRKGSAEEDRVVSEAAEELIKGSMDADMVNKVDLHTGINLRDHVTIEEIEDWARDRDLRRMTNRN